MNHSNNHEAQNARMDASFESRGFRAGAVIALAGVLGAVGGAVEAVTNDSSEAIIDELANSYIIAGSYVTVMVGTLVASVSGIRAVNRHERKNPNL